MAASFDISFQESSVLPSSIKINSPLSFDVLSTFLIQVYSSPIDSCSSNTGIIKETLFLATDTIVILRIRALYV